MRKWFKEKFIPTVSKLGNQKHLASIRDAFAIFTPIIIVGALATLWRSAIVSPGGGKGTLSGLWVAYNDFTPTGQYKEFLDVMSNWLLYVQVGIINCLALYVAFGVGYFLAKSRGNNAPVIAGLTSLASFLSVTSLMITGSWEGGMYWLGARGLITAIVLGLIVTEIYCWLSKGDRMAIKMPAGVPPAVSRSFAKMLPVIFTVLAAATINWILVFMPFYFTESTLSEGATTRFTVTVGSANPLDQVQVDALKGVITDKAVLATINVGSTGSWSFQGVTGDPLGAVMKAFKGVPNFLSTTTVDQALHGGITLTAAIYCGVVAPFIALSSDTAFAFGLAILYVMLVSFFWFFGLHGTNIVNGAFNPIWLILYAENVAGANHVFVQGTFDAYVFIGGWGATLPLVLSTLAFGKRDSSYYEVSKFAVGPSLFQINEPVTFGYPLVLNGLLAIPLFLVMPALVVTTYMGIAWFGVPVVTVLIPWTAPVGIGGLLASASGWGFVLALANMLIAAAVWTPFVLLMKKTDGAALQKAASSTEEGKKVAAKKVKAAA